MTPARLELLRAIERGEVTRFYPVHRLSRKAYDRRTFPDGRVQTVTSAVQALREAQPDMLASPGPSASWSAFAPKVWVLTEAGRAILRRSE